MKQDPKVFVIDVNPAVLSSIESLLIAQRYQVLCFDSAEEFIAQHQPTHVGGVVMDLSVSGANGIELIRHLHESRMQWSIRRGRHSATVKDSIVELCRVAKEVRTFPLLELGGAPSRHAPPVMDTLQRIGLIVKIETVDCEFQRGGNQMMRITS